MKLKFSDRFLKYSLITIFALAVFITASLFFLSSYGQQLEFKAFDFYQQKKPLNTSTTSDIVIVAVDDESFQSFDIQWPFPRTFHSKLIRNLKKAGAKQIIFDIEFSEASDYNIDKDIGTAAREHSNVILAGKIYNIKQDDFYSTTVLPPTKAITNESKLWGIVNMSNDMDSFVRKYPLFHKINDKMFYSLALSSYLHLIDKDTKLTFDKHSLKINKLKIPLVSYNETILNYYGPAKTFKHIPFSSVVDDSSFNLPMEDFFPVNDYYHLLSNNVFKDKIVLVGATVDELKDNFNTPVNKKNTMMPGVEIHANMIQMLLDNNFLFQVSKVYYHIFLLLFLLILSGIFYFLKPHIGLIITLIVVFANLTIIYFLVTKFNLLIPILVLPFSVIILYIIWLIYHYLMENKEKKAIKKTFQHYMAPTLVKELLKSPEKLKYGGSLTEISVLFSDIRSFTTYTESHDVQDTVSMLREYLTDMVNTIIDNQGILDKFVGDEVMALFNTPVPIENHPLKACRCALQMIEHLRKLQDKWRAEGKEIIEIGVGVNTGNAVVGNLGSEQIFDYTAIGDTINLGARLEALNKNYKTANHIIISEFTLAHVKDFIIYEYLDEVIVKGKTKPIKIYQLIDILEEYK